MKYDYFIASRWRNKTLVESLTEKIRYKGKSVYSFLEGDGREHSLKQDEQSMPPEAFMQKFENIPNWKENQAIREIFEMDLQGLKESAHFILLLPAGKSAHIEAGTAFGLGKKCIVIGEQKEAEASYLIFDAFYPSIDDFIETLH